MATHIALDSFTPTEACFEQPPKSATQKDNCSVTVSFHLSNELSTQYRPVIFQREKDHYVIDPNQPSSELSIIHALFPADKLDSIQSILHFSVAISKLHRETYPALKTGTSTDEGEVILPYGGPDFKPLLSKVISFCAAGNIESPDSVQTKNNSEITREVLNLSHSPQTWFLVLYKTLLNERANLNKTPVPTRPRVQWFIDQLDCMGKLVKPFVTTSAKSKQDGVDLAFQQDSALQPLFIDLLDHLFNNSSTPEKILAKIDPVAARIYKAKNTPVSQKDFYVFLQSKLNEFSQKPFFINNAAGRQRLNTLRALLNNAVSEHRAELLSLEPNAAFKKSLEYSILAAAEKESFTDTVKAELEQAHLYPKWIQENAREIANELLPHFYFQPGPTPSPRVKVDADAMLESINRLAETEHYIQKREYRIGALAILRHLLGNNLSNPKIKGWHQNGIKEIELNVVGGDHLRTLSPVAIKLSLDIDNSVFFTDKVVPWIELGTAGAGLGIAVGGVVKDGFHRSALNVTGVSMMGFGLTSFTCDKLWKTRNNMLSDLGCGLLGAAVFGTVSYFALPQQPGEIISNPSGNSSNIDGRNPVTGYGP